MCILSVKIYYDGGGGGEESCYLMSNYNNFLLTWLIRFSSFVFSYIDIEWEMPHEVWGSDLFNCKLQIIDFIDHELGILWWKVEKYVILQ